MAGETTEELERFRQQWQQEVTQRTKGSPFVSLNKSARPPRLSQISNQAISPERSTPSLLRRKTREDEAHFDETGGHGYHDLDNKDDARRLGEGGARIHPSNREEPRSALDHYELAVERESEGSLGDSLNHYRKAYRVGTYLFHLEIKHGIDMKPARCRRRPHLQKQTLPTLILQVETSQPESIKCGCHRPESRPSLPRWTLRLHYIRAHNLLLIPLYTS